MYRHGSYWKRKHSPAERARRQAVHGHWMKDAVKHRLCPPVPDHYNPTRAQLHLRTKPTVYLGVSVCFQQRLLQRFQALRISAMSTALAAIFWQAWSQERYFSTRKYHREIDNFLCNLKHSRIKFKFV